MNTQLYPVAPKYEAILNNLYDELGQINQSAVQELDKIEDTQEKGIAIASFIHNLECERVSIEAAKKLLKEKQENMEHREAVFHKKMDDLNGYLLNNMQRKQINKISCPYFEITVKKCPYSVDVTDATLIPEEYMKTKTVITPDKNKIRDELKVGVIVPGARLLQNMRLEIK